MPMIVATHNGPFHADDVLAWALLRQFMEEDLELIRTRDANRLNEADIVIDVGGEYDPHDGVLTITSTLTKAPIRALEWS